MGNLMMIQKPMYFKKWIYNGNFDSKFTKPIENLVENLAYNYRNQFLLSSLQNFDDEIAKIKIDLSQNRKIKKKVLFLKTEILGSDFDFDISKTL